MSKLSTVVWFLVIFLSPAAYALDVTPLALEGKKIIPQRTGHWLNQDAETMRSFGVGMALVPEVIVNEPTVRGMYSQETGAITLREDLFMGPLSRANRSTVIHEKYHALLDQKRKAKREDIFFQSAVAKEGSLSFVGAFPIAESPYGKILAIEELPAFLENFEILNQDRSQKNQSEDFYSEIDANIDSAVINYTYIFSAMTELYRKVDPQEGRCGVRIIAEKGAVETSFEVFLETQHGWLIQFVYDPLLRERLKAGSNIESCSVFARAYLGLKISAAQRVLEKLRESRAKLLKAIAMAKSKQTNLRKPLRYFEPNTIALIKQVIAQEQKEFDEKLLTLGQ